MLGLRQVQPEPSRGTAGRLLVRSGPWRFLPPRHISHLPTVPGSSPASMPSLAMLSVPLGSLLRIQPLHPINAEPRVGNARGQFPHPGAVRVAEHQTGHLGSSRANATHPPGPAFPGMPSPPATDSPRLAWPAPASLPHHTGTGTGTGGMEPARTMADLIRTSTDGNGARPQ